MQRIHVKNHNNKLQGEYFIHLAPLKKKIPRKTPMEVVDETGQVYEFHYWERVDDLTLTTIPTVFSWLSHAMSLEDLIERVFPDVDPKTEEFACHVFRNSKYVIHEQQAQEHPNPPLESSESHHLGGSVRKPNVVVQSNQEANPIQGQTTPSFTRKAG